jgi:uncharacterized protein
LHPASQHEFDADGVTHDVPIAAVISLRGAMPIYLPIAGISLDLGLLVTLGLAVGVLAGLFGIGGGFIMTPALIFLGVPSGVAVGTGAAQVVASSISGALGHWQKRNVDTKLGSILIFGGLWGAFVGVKLQVVLKAAGHLDLFIACAYVIMLGVVGSLMLIESLKTISGVARGKPASIRRAGQHNAIERLPFKMRFRTSKIYASAIPPLIIGAFVGLLTAIMGIGGGFLLIPALIYLLRLPTRLAMGTAAFQIIFITGVTTIMQAVQNQTVDLMLGAPLMFGGVVGAQIGIRIGERLRAEQLRLLLALLVLAVAGRMLIGLVAAPSEAFVLDVQ